MKKVILFLFATSQMAISQTIVLKPFQASIAQGTCEHLKNYKLLSFEIKSLVDKIDAIPGNVKEITLETPSKKFRLQLFEYSLLSDDYKRYSGDPNAVNILPQRKDFRTFKGTIKGISSSVVAMSVANGYFTIMIDDKINRYFIEPLDLESVSPLIPADQQFILYNSADLIPLKGIKCAADLFNQEVNNIKAQVQSSSSSLRPCILCFEVKICLAADFLMYRKYGNDVMKTEDQILGVLADVQTVFDDEFDYEYFFSVTGTYVADVQARDPWNGINNINTFLTKFASVATTIFPFSEFNLATAWTTKFTAGEVGTAYQSSLCVSNPYNVCSDYLGFGGKNDFYLCEQAHEIGHNWGMNHDPGFSPCIMKPGAPNGARIWSFLSKDALNDYFNNGAFNCLVTCPNSDAPIPEFIADITSGCQPVKVQFTDLSQNTTIWKWRFPGGIPDSSSEQNPLVVYTTFGKFPVTLEAGNDRCDVALTKTNYIDINDKPIVDFIYGVNAGREVFFSNTTQRGIYFLWKFGDGEESDEMDPIHIYERDSTYEVTLIATNACGTVSIKKKFKVISLPVADFDADTTGGCAPKIIKFLDKSSNNVIKWIWEFPGGNPDFSNAQNPSIRYDNPGVYDAKLTVLSANNSNKLTKKLYITIDSLPEAKFDFAFNGNTVSFNNSSRFSKSHVWFFGDNTSSSEANPSHVYLEGKYEVVYVVVNACGTDTAKTFITIGTKPVAGFKVANQAGCVPFQVQFTNTTTAGATAFKWYFPGGNPSTSTDKDPLITYNNAGKFNVSLFAYNNFFSDSIGFTDFIEVKSEPTSDFTNTISGFKSFFTHQAIGAGNYFWDFGDGHFSFEENPTYDYGVEGEFDVRLIVQNDCGLDTFEKHIAIYLVPKVNFTVDTIRGCAPLTVKFFDKSSIDVNDWDWFFENGNPSTSTEKNPTVVFTKKGKYSVKLSVKNTNGSNQLTRTQYIQVLSPVLCPEQTKAKQFVLSEDPFDVNIQNRANHFDSELPFVYPIPAQDYIYVYIGKDSGESVSIELYDLSGRKLSKYTSKESLLRIQTGQLKSGTYYIKIYDDSQSSICKFVISE